MDMMNRTEFEPLPRESGKAFAAFRAYLELGPERSLVAVAAKLGKSKPLVERWSRKFDWAGRVAAHTNHLALVERQAAEALAIANGEEWARRQALHREDEWSLRTELIAAGRKVLEKFQDGSRGATLGDVARALELASKLGRLASGLATEPKDEAPQADKGVLIAIELALDRVYGPEQAAIDVEVVKEKGAGQLPPATEVKP